MTSPLPNMYGGALVEQLNAQVGRLLAVIQTAQSCLSVGSTYFLICFGCISVHGVHKMYCVGSFYFMAVK